MSLLPIVERELRVASRRKGTYRMRSLLALAVVVLWFFLLMTGNNSNAEKGPILFVAIGVLGLAWWQSRVYWQQVARIDSGL